MKINNNGYTLIELILVMTIISIISVITIPTYIGLASDLKDLIQIRQANEALLNKNLDTDALFDEYIKDSSILLNLSQ